LEKIDGIVPHQVDDAVLGRQAPAPHVWAKVLHGLRLADADGRIAHDGFDDLERSSRSSRVRFHPPRQILPELILEEGDAVLLTAGAQ
jgi:hypothetical protein